MQISGLSWALRHKREFDAVLTIEDPGHHSRQLRFHRNPHPHHLILQFFDLDYAIPDPYHKPWMTLASRENIAAAIAFGQQHANLLIHCRAGVSRSTAVAMTILAALGDDPQLALTTMLQLRPIAVPNRHVIALADDMLGYDGKLLEALDVWERSVQNNAMRRRLCRLAHYYEFGIPLTIGV